MKIKLTGYTADNQAKTVEAEYRLGKKGKNPNHLIINSKTLKEIVALDLRKRILKNKMPIKVSLTEEVTENNAKVFINRGITYQGLEDHFSGDNLYSLDDSALVAPLLSGESIQAEQEPEKTSTLISSGKRKQSPDNHENRTIENKATKYHHPKNKRRLELTPPVSRKKPKHRSGRSVAMISLRALNDDHHPRPATSEVIKHNREGVKTFLLDKKYPHQPRDIQIPAFGEYANADPTTRTMVFDYATGTGKTYIFSQIARIATAKEGARVLILTPRRNLLSQTVEEIQTFCGENIRVGVYGYDNTLVKIKKRGFDKNQLFKNDVVIATVQGFFNRNKDDDILAAIKRHNITTIIVDEAHDTILSGSRNTTLQKILDLEQPPEVLAFTATPEIATRNAQQIHKGATSSVYKALRRTKEDNPITPVSFREAIDRGGNCPLSCGYILAKEVSLTKKLETMLKNEASAGIDSEYTSKQLQNIITPVINKQAAEVQLFGKDRFGQQNNQGQGIIFCSDINHANTMVEILTQTLLTRFKHDISIIIDQALSQQQSVEQALKSYFQIDKADPDIQELIVKDINRFVEAFKRNYETKHSDHSIDKIIDSLSKDIVMPVAMNVVDPQGKERHQYLKNCFKDFSAVHPEKLTNKWHAFKLAAAIHSRKNERENGKILKKQAKGGIKYLTGADKLIEGFDCPPLRNVMFIRPTRSEWLPVQGVGRGLRTDKNNPDKYCRAYFMVYPNMPGQNTFVHNITDYTKDEACEFSYGMDKIPGLTKVDTEDKNLIFNGDQLKNSHLFIPVQVKQRSTRQGDGKDQDLSPEQQKLNQEVLEAVNEIETIFTELSSLTKTNEIRTTEILADIDTVLDQDSDEEEESEDNFDLNMPVLRHIDKNNCEKGDRSLASNSRTTPKNLRKPLKDKEPEDDPMPLSKADKQAIVKNSAINQSINRFVQSLEDHLKISRNYSGNRHEQIKDKQRRQGPGRLVKPSIIYQLVQKLQALKQINLTMDEDEIRGLIAEAKELMRKVVEKNNHQHEFKKTTIVDIREQLIQQLNNISNRNPDLTVDTLINKGFKTEKELGILIRDAFPRAREIDESRSPTSINSDGNTMFHWACAREMKYTYESELLSKLLKIYEKHRLRVDPKRNNTGFDDFKYIKNTLGFNFLDIFAFFNCEPLTKDEKFINKFLQTLYICDFDIATLYNRDNPVYAFDTDLNDKIQTLIKLQSVRKNGASGRQHDINTNHLIEMELYNTWGLHKISDENFSELIEKGLLNKLAKMDYSKFDFQVCNEIKEHLKIYSENIKDAKPKYRQQFHQMYESLVNTSVLQRIKLPEEFHKAYYQIEENKKQSLNMVQQLKRDYFLTEGFGYRDCLSAVEKGLDDKSPSIFEKDHLNCSSFQLIGEILTGYSKGANVDRFLQIIEKVNNIRPEEIYSKQRNGRTLLNSLFDIDDSVEYINKIITFLLDKNIDIKRLLDSSKVADKDLLVNLKAIASLQSYSKGTITIDRIDLDSLIKSRSLKSLPDDLLNNDQFMGRLIKLLPSYVRIATTAWASQRIKSKNRTKNPEARLLQEEIDVAEKYPYPQAYYDTVIPIISLLKSYFSNNNNEDNQKLLMQALKHLNDRKQALDQDEYKPTDINIFLNSENDILKDIQSLFQSLPDNNNPTMGGNTDNYHPDTEELSSVPAVPPSNEFDELAMMISPGDEYLPFVDDDDFSTLFEEGEFDWQIDQFTGGKSESPTFEPLENLGVEEKSLTVSNQAKAGPLNEKSIPKNIQQDGPGRPSVSSTWATFFNNGAFEREIPSFTDDLEWAMDTIFNDDGTFPG